MNPIEQTEPVAPAVPTELPSESTPEVATSDYNKVEIPSDSFPDASEGDEVETTVKGIITLKDDGTRCIEVTSVDNTPLSDKPEGPEPTEEQASEEAKNSTGDLVSKLKALNQGKTSMYE